MQKILFFDVDGTLIDYRGILCDSTKEALLKAKEHGHKILVCTGRSKCQIAEKLMQIGFDGYVCATGAYVECDGKTVYSHMMPEEDVRRIVALMKKENMLYHLQTKDHLVSDPKQQARMEALLRERYGVTEDVLQEDRKRQAITEDMEAYYGQVEKMMYHESPIPVAEVQRILGGTVRVTRTSFEKPDETTGEITVEGIHKALGMEKALQYYHAKRADSIAFGDSVNDIEMMEYAGCGVAMGNAVAEVKQKADLVTDAVDQDGIRNAMVKLGLID